MLKSEEFIKSYVPIKSTLVSSARLETYSVGQTKEVFTDLLTSLQADVEKIMKLLQTIDDMNDKFPPIDPRDPDYS